MTDAIDEVEDSGAMFHGHCPFCHSHSLGLDYPSAPEYLTDEEYNAWLESGAADEPIGVICDNCGYQEE
ncbi:hypothetical protein [Ferrovibrio sp.]|uniref:hypothetical protein n=1 Tax=Ferrovibrio sp. TaxID=1917215 RepID=UPI003D0DEA0E